MATRKKKNSLLHDMGIDQKDFQDLFLLSLQDESFRKQVKTELGHDELLTEISTLRAACQKKDTRIVELERHSKEMDALMDALEQYSRGNSMRIDGIKENDTECLTHTVLHLFNTRMQVSPPLLPSDIDRVHRVGKKSPGKNRTVLVKFTTGIAKDKVYRVRSKLKPDARSPTEPWKPLPTSGPGYTPPPGEFPAMENPNAATLTSGPETILMLQLICQLVQILMNALLMTKEITTRLLLYRTRLLRRLVGKSFSMTISLIPATICCTSRVKPSAVDLSTMYGL